MELLYIWFNWTGKMPCSIQTINLRWRQKLQLHTDSILHTYWAPRETDRQAWVFAFFNCNLSFESCQKKKKSWVGFEMPVRKMKGWSYFGDWKVLKQEGGVLTSPTYLNLCTPHGSQAEQANRQTGARRRQGARSGILVLPQPRVSLLSVSLINEPLSSHESHLTGTTQINTEWKLAVEQPCSRPPLQARLLRCQVIEMFKQDSCVLLHQHLEMVWKLKRQLRVVFFPPISGDSRHILLWIVWDETLSMVRQCIL